MGREQSKITCIHKKGIYEKNIKRILDIIISLMGLIVLFPLLLFLTMLGTIAMRGNPFFIQERPGMINPQNGKEKIFKLIKFRTMNNRTDKNGNLFPDSQRLTTYGKILRSTSLDELPELINILKGDMSVVGPRPLLVRYLPRYSKEQRQRHIVRPGLTGYAQVNGRNVLTWNEKFQLDVWYTKNVSFKSDLKIFVQTIVTVFKREGISSETSATMEEFLGDEK